MKKFFIAVGGILTSAVVFLFVLQLQSDSPLFTANGAKNLMSKAESTMGAIKNAALSLKDVQTAAIKITPPPTIKMKNGEEGTLIPILVYHRIGFAPANATSAYKSYLIEPEWFEKHLQYLKDNGFEAIQYADLINYMDYGAPLPAKPVMINFDDGFTNAYDVVFPILKKFNMKATLFVITNSVGHGLYASWDQLKEMQKSGLMEMGSHTLWHPYLTKSGKAVKEITESKQKLEKELGVQIDAFAYPYGDWNENVAKMVKDAGYKIGRSFSTGNGINENNRFHVPVVRVYASVGLERWKSQLFP